VAVAPSPSGDRPIGSGGSGSLRSCSSRRGRGSNCIRFPVVCVVAPTPPQGHRDLVELKRGLAGSGGLGSHSPESPRPVGWTRGGVPCDREQEQ